MKTTEESHNRDVSLTLDKGKQELKDQDMMSSHSEALAEESNNRG